jgi:hypothetical protein
MIVKIKWNVKGGGGEEGRESGMGEYNNNTILTIFDEWNLVIGVNSLK